MPFYGDRSEYTVWNEAWDPIKAERYIKTIAMKQEKGGSTVWTLPRESEYLHPTQKPVALIATALRNSSKREDIVLDLFAGSGSTMIACHRAKRYARSMELDPLWCDVAVMRWEAYTGETAKLERGEG